MNVIASKLQASTAALAVATATTLVPVAAHAAPAISVPAAPIIQMIDRVPEVVGAGQLKDFSFFIFGTPDPTPPAHITLLNNLTIPIISALLVGLGLANKEICLGGAAVKIGSYGGITVQLGLGC
jgi:hypothetical protein